jgi:hypothetical protein
MLQKPFTFHANWMGDLVRGTVQLDSFLASLRKNLVHYYDMARFALS